MDYTLINQLISPEGKSHSNLGISVPYPDYKTIKLADSLLPIHQRVLKAKQIMESLGYGPNNKLELNFLGSKGDLYSRVQLAIASMLSQAHIDAKIHSHNATQYWDEFHNGHYDLVLNGWFADILDPSNFLEGTLASLIIPPQLSKKFTQQLNKTYSTFNRKQRMNQLAQIEHSMLKSFYLVPLFRYQNHYLLRPGFQLLDEPMMSARNIINKDCKPSRDTTTY